MTVQRVPCVQGCTQTCAKVPGRTRSIQSKTHLPIFRCDETHQLYSDTWTTESLHRTSCWQPVQRSMGVTPKLRFNLTIHTVSLVLALHSKLGRTDNHTTIQTFHDNSQTGHYHFQKCEVCKHAHLRMLHKVVDFCWEWGEGHGWGLDQFVPKGCGVGSPEHQSTI